MVRSFLSRLWPSLVVAMAMSSVSTGAITYKPGVTDFYQHQKSFQTPWNWRGGAGYPGPPAAIPAPLRPSYTPPNWWESNGGWCETTAFVNALQYVDVQLGAAGLYDHSRGHLSGLPEHAAAHTWQERFNYANEDLAIMAGGTNGSCADPATVRAYANKWGVGLTVQEFSWNTTNNKVYTRSATGAAYTDASGTYSSLFDVAKQRFDDGIMVMMIRGNADAWWGGTGPGSFHALTIAGIDVGAKMLAFSDPNDTFRGADWGFSYLNTDGLPTDNTYKGTLTLADGRTIGNHRATYNGVEAAVNAYNGAFATEIFLLTIPGPGGVCLTLVGSLIAIRRRRA